MENREKLLLILSEQVANKNIIKHMLATEACMLALARHLITKNLKLKTEEIREDEWGFAGLMHDGDYRDDVPVDQQGIKIVEVLKEKGIEVSANVAHAMAAHNWQNTKVNPESLMDWALCCADSLTGLIVATALVLPAKKLAEVTLQRVMNRFAEPKFAAGTRREEVKLCEEKLGIKLEDFIGICLKAMQGISENLGL